MSVDTSRSSLQNASIAGGIAWIVGLIIAYILLQLDLIGGPFGSALASSFEFVVTLFTTLHLWTLLFDNASSTDLVWSIVPIVILVITGYVVALGTDGGAEEGALTVVGYFILSVLAVIYLILTFGVGQAEYVQMLAYLVIGGVLFPIVFGGIGGWIAQEV